MDFGCFIAKKREDPGGKKIGNTFFNVLFCNQYNVFDCMNLKNVNVWLVRVMWRRYKQLTRIEVKKKGLEIHVVITRECYHHRVFVSSLNSYHDGPFRVIGAFWSEFLHTICYSHVFNVTASLTPCCSNIPRFTWFVRFFNRIQIEFKKHTNHSCISPRILP